jgi:hypothetical protein
VVSHHQTLANSRWCLIPNLSSYFPFLNQLPSNRLLEVAISLFEEALIFLLVTVVYFLVLQPILERIVQLFTIWRRRGRLRDQQYYYEMDLTLDASMDPTQPARQKQPTITEQLLDGDFSGERLYWSWPPAPWRARRQFPCVDRRKVFAPSRNSYRINRGRPDEASHKVYVAAHVFWPGPLRWMPAWLASNRL